MTQTQLTAAFVKSVKKPGRYFDGGGLLLRVRESGSKGWQLRVMIHGKRRDISLGSLDRVGLAEARLQAATMRAEARAGGDPTAVEAEPERAPTFSEAFERVLDLKRPGWKHAGKSEGQWRASYRDYMKPLADMPLDEIKTEHVLDCLSPIWHRKHETARRTKQRISEVLEWAIAHDYRADNPAMRVTRLLGSNHQRRKHFRALEYGRVSEAIATVQSSAAWPSTKLAIEFAILTAARSGEVRGAWWDEMDLTAATWTVPAERMKAKREHRVPLSGRTLDVLAEAREYYSGGGLVFPSMRGREMTDSTMSKLIRELGIESTVHGFRSSFRQWSAEQTNFPREICELALAHVNSDRVEAAYMRSDLFDRRRDLMDAWAAFLAPRHDDDKIIRPKAFGG